MSDTKRTVDLVVVGGGPGGYTAAFLAADRGMSVALIDDAPRPGGVCLYRGCMPSKALLHAAKVLTDADFDRDCPGANPNQPSRTVRELLAIIVNDNVQHIGQIAFLRGMVRGQGWY